MKVTSVLKRDYIIGDLEATDKEGAIKEILTVFPPEVLPVESPIAFKVLMEREMLGSTGIGDGVAIPHGTIGGLEEILLACGRSKKGIFFSSCDGKPVYLIFLMLAPENYAGQHLKLLAKISKMLRDGSFRSSLIEAATVDEMYDVIAEKDDQF